MRDLQLTLVALVGARMDLFQPYGYRVRSELSLRPVPPEIPAPLAQLDPAVCGKTLAAQLPLWIHNIVVDRDFPAREQLLSPLRRFEGELRDHRDNEVVAAVLSAGFRDQVLDPVNLPHSLPMRLRCTLLMQADVWQSAYRELEHSLLAIMCDRAPELDAWRERVRETGLTEPA